MGRRVVLAVALGVVACGGSSQEPRVDPAQSTFTLDRTTAVVGVDVIQVTIVLRDAQGQPVPGAHVVLAASGTDNTISDPPLSNASGLTTATWSSTKVQLATLTGTVDGDIVGAASVMFLAGTPTQLRFVQQPMTAEAGGTFAVSAELEDAYGNPTAATAPAVDIELAVNPGAAVLGGTLLQSPVQGVATFADLHINVPATGYVLRATALGLTPADSDPFDVVPGEPSAQDSSLTVTPLALPADGVSTANITVTVANQHGVAIEGQTVQLSASGSNNTLTPNAGATDASGVLSATWTSTTAEQKTLTATIGSVTLTATVTFFSPPCKLHVPGPTFAAADRAVTAFTIGDFDGDGHVDTVDAEPDLNKLVVRRGSADGTFLQSIDTAVTGNVQWLSAADINADGYLDVIATATDVNGAIILLGNGNGTFAPPTVHALAASATSVAIADFNQDGTLDLAAALGSANQITVHLGSGTGTFGAAAATIATPHGNPSWLNAGDLNNDGRPDLVVVNLGDLSMSAFLASGAATFGGEVYTPDYGKLLLRDVNHDGRLDAVLAPTQGTTLHVRVGNGAGGFTLSQYLDTGAQNGSVAVADFDGDTHPDIITAMGSRFVFIHGVGDGTFILSRAYASAAYPSGGLGGGAATADVDGDGRADVVLGGTLVGTVLNLGAGRFSLPPVVAPERVTFEQTANFNGDSYPDLFAHHGDFLSGAALLGSSSGSFTRVGNSVQIAQGAAGVFADVNEDGNQDVIVFDGPSFVARMLLGSGGGVFQTGPTVTIPYSEEGTVADVNNDGHADLIVIGQSVSSRGLYVSFGTGMASFGTATFYALAFDPVRVIAIDADADGDRDLIVGTYKAVYVFRNNGTGTFTETIAYWGATSTASISSVTTADFDFDGNLDIAFTDTRVHLLFGQANGTYAQGPQAYLLTQNPYVSLYRISAADLDGSGTQDLVVDTGIGFVVLQGIGDGTFAPPVKLGYGGYSGISLGSPFVVADMNVDGQPDLAFSTYFGVALAVQGVCVR